MTLNTSSSAACLSLLTLSLASAWYGCSSFPGVIYLSKRELDNPETLEGRVQREMCGAWTLYFTAAVLCSLTGHLRDEKPGSWRSINI